MNFLFVMSVHVTIEEEQEGLVVFRAVNKLAYMIIKFDTVVLPVWNLSLLVIMTYM